MMSRKETLTPEEQLKVLARIWGRPGVDEFEDGWVFLPTIPGWTMNKEQRRANWHENKEFKWPEDENKILEHLRANKNNDLYFTPNVFVGRSRERHLVAEERTLYADLDETDPRFLDPELKPTIAWMTSSYAGNERFQGVWLLDRMHIAASERFGLNHRLSAYVGADPSGWDSTQVLRVPGRPNFKFEYKDEDGRPSPGALLWVREKRFSPDYLEEQLPVIPGMEMHAEVEDAEIDAVDRRAVWARVRLKVSHNVRQYMRMKSWEAESGDHDRSDVLWQIERDLADAGCTVAEIVAIVRASPWNKFSGRSNEITQLKSEAIKAKAEVLNASDDEQPLELDDEIVKPEGPKWLSYALSLPTRRPNWLVKNIWMKGSVGFISGAPKSYKSWFALDMAISVAMGIPFLNDDKQFPVHGARKVLYLQEEDTQGLVHHRVHQIIDGKDAQLSPNGFFENVRVNPPKRASGPLTDILEGDYVGPTPNESLALHVREGFVASSPVWQDWLDEFVREYGFELVVIDTLGTTAGDIDTDKAQVLNERILKPLKEIAAQRDCALVIVHHNRKASDDKGRSGQQMLGSVALHAWIESALYLTTEDVMTGHPSIVKVHAENKLSEGMKFRVKIPRMFEETRGDLETANRQVWEPEILVGWGDSADDRKERDAQAETEPKRSTAGKSVAELFKQMKGGAGTIDELIAHTGQPNRRKQYEDQIKKAIDNGYLALDEDGVYVSMV